MRGLVMTSSYLTNEVNDISIGIVTADEFSETPLVKFFSRSFIADLLKMVISTDR